MSNDFSVNRPLLGAPFDKRVSIEWLTANENAPMRAFNPDVDVDLIDEVNRVLNNIYQAIIDQGYLSLPGNAVYALSLFKKSFPGSSFTVKTSAGVTKNYRFIFGDNFSGGRVVETDLWITPVQSNANASADHLAASARVKQRQQPTYTKFSVLRQTITVKKLYALFFVNRFTYIDDVPETYGEEFGLQTADVKMFILDNTGTRVYDTEYKRITSNQGNLLTYFDVNIALPIGDYSIGIEMTNLSPSESENSPYFCSLVPATDDPAFSNLIAQRQAQANYDIEEVKTGFISRHRTVYKLSDNQAIGNWDYSTTIEFETPVAFAEGHGAAVGQDFEVSGMANAYLVNASGLMQVMAETSRLPKQKLVVEFTIPSSPLSPLHNAFTFDFALDTNDTNRSDEFLVPARFVRYGGETKWHVEGTEYLIADLNANYVLNDIWLDPDVKYRAEFEFRYQLNQKQNSAYGTPGAYYTGYWVFLTGLFDATTGDYIAGGPAMLWCNPQKISLANYQRLTTLNPKYVLRQPGVAPSGTLNYLADERSSRMNYAPPNYYSNVNQVVPILLSHKVVIHKWIEERGL